MLQVLEPEQGTDGDDSGRLSRVLDARPRTELGGVDAGRITRAFAGSNPSDVARSRMSNDTQ